MRYCHHCHQITAGDPQFCNSCGRTYNIKLCSRLHVNPRAAQVCSQCGSRDLTTPQPKIPLLLRPLLWLLRIGIGGLLIMTLVIWMGVYVYRLFTNPNGLLSLMCVALSLGLLLYLWMLLPKGFRGFIARIAIGKGRDSAHK